MVRRGHVVTAIAAVISPLVFAAGVPQFFPVTPAQKSHRAPRTLVSLPLVRTAPGTTVSPRGTRLWTDPANPSAAAASRTAATAPATAALLAKMGRQPQSTWLGEWLTPARATSFVAGKASAARNAGQVPVFVVYAIPYRDCGSYSAGGASDAAQYRSLVDGIAAGLTGGRAVVVLEPDAVASMGCLPADGQAARLALLRYGVSALTRNPGTSVYLDGGNAHWQPAAVMATRLRSAGIDTARGFVVNAGNFDPTDSEIAYGKQIGAALGAEVPFVVDTSRNGLGRFVGDQGWCNPPGRALGVRPTTVTADPLVDAYLWVKTPGLSDGTCRGGPRAGVWWQDYAVGLVSRAAW